MTRPKRESFSDVDAGWDALSSGTLVARAAARPPQDLTDLDEGWQEPETSGSDDIAVAVSAKDGAARLSPRNLNHHELHALDEGWEHAIHREQAVEPANAPRIETKTRAPGLPVLGPLPSRASKKELRQLERERRAQKALTDKERSLSRKQSRRKNDARASLTVAKPTSCDTKAKKQKRERSQKQSQKTQSKAQTERVTVDRSLQAPSPSLTTPSEHRLEATKQQAAPLVQGWMLWAAVAVILVLLGYYVSR